MVIWINVNSEINDATIEEWNKIDIFMVNKIFSKRKLWMDDSWIDINENSWMFITVDQLSCKYDPWRVIVNTYNFFTFFKYQAWKSLNNRLWKFLSKYNIKVLLFSKIILVRRWFFQIFWENIKFFTIINLPFSQLSKLICLFLHRVLDTC